VVLTLCVTAPAASAADPRTWHLRNSNSLGVADVSVGYGDTSQTPIVGDWNGDGKDSPGMVRPSTWWLSNTLTGTTAQYFAYGSAGMVPIPGDWDGNGTSTVGMRQGLRWLLANVNGNVTASIDFNLGNPSGDVPLSGDWNGDGKDTPGVYRRSNHTFYLAGGLSSTCCVASVSYGIVGDTPLVGDWNGDGKDTIGVYRVDGFGAHWQLNNANDASTPDYDFVYGSPGDVPVTGDWNGDGTDTVGVVRTGGAPPPDPYPTSTRYGGANKSVDTDAEADALMAAATATDEAGQASLWNGLKDEDQGYVAMTRGGDPEVTLESTEEEVEPATIFESQALEDEALPPPELGEEPPVEPTPEPTAEPTPDPTAEPTPEPTAEPTPEPDGDGTVEEMAVSRCKKIKWTYHIKIPISWAPDLHPGNAIHRVRFCFNKKRKTSMYGGTNLVEEDLNTKGVVAGVSVDQLEAPTPYHEEWNGARRGQIHIERPWKLTWCRAACVVKATYHAVKWGHYDGTWVDRSF
jgi:hypothetical protein